MSWIASGIAAGGALIKGVSGIVQTHKANQIDKNNPFPQMGVQNEYQQNVNQAQQMAQDGMPAQQYNNQLNAINQNQAGALQTLSRSSNPGANLASIVRQGSAATGNLNAQSAIDRNRSMINLLQERHMLAQQKDKAWDWNFQQKYLGNLAKSQALRQTGNQNISGALSDLSGAATSLSGLGSFSGGGGSSSAGYNPYNYAGAGIDVSSPAPFTGWGTGDTNPNMFNPEQNFMGKI